MKREKLKIVSDGTGAGTVLMLGDTRIDGVRSLRLDITRRSSKAVVEIEVNADLYLECEAVQYGDSEELTRRMKGEDDEQ